MPPTRPLVRADRPVVEALPAGPGRRVSLLGRPAGGPTGGSDRPLIHRLRSPLGMRPVVDPGLAGGIRAWLEDAAAAPPGPEVPTTVRLGGCGRLVACRPHSALSFSARAGEPVAGRCRVATEDVHAAIVGALFRIVLTTGPRRLTFDDAVAALAVDDRCAAIVEAIGHLPRDARASLRDAVRLEAATIASQWAPPPAAWLPRTEERVTVPLAGGRVVLRATAHLMMGAPADGRASVCALRLQTRGAARSNPSGRRFLALLETLRSGAAPFRVASYEPAHARLTVDDVTDDLLFDAVADVLHVLRGQPA